MARAGGSPAAVAGVMNAAQQAQNQSLAQIAAQAAQAYQQGASQAGQLTSAAQATLNDDLKTQVDKARTELTSYDPQAAQQLMQGYYNNPTFMQGVMDAMGQAGNMYGTRLGNEDLSQLFATKRHKRLADWWSDPNMQPHLQALTQNGTSFSGLF
jgi:cell pole-organizing protein PopZ